ncbi:UNVERIFIED_CONTAM: hypothetical protein Scaly_0008500 [Sesamum calycinum]|uniref:MULE transposase domain-containing protein n=1 Tax=Sesamum calycinum TaxID=2727403 RepID=A0AAW2SSR7_9LAMI
MRRSCSKQWSEDEFEKLQLLDFPNPKYDKYGLDRFVTIILYHGGEVKHSPIAEFVGGNQRKFDFVDVEDMCISYLNGLGEKLGYMGPKRFYRLDSNRNKFRVISYQTDVLALCDGYSSKNREFTLYLEANSDEPATQIGSSNPIAVVGDEKGKGVAIEGVVSPRFDEEDWAEVFKLVDSYGEGAGWNCDQEDEEDGENRDEEGVQKGEQESSESDNSYFRFCVSEDDFDSEGFLHGCRPVIGVDGCHLKGPHGGILLTAVSIDPNNNLYPLAYAVVSGETRESWEWFLELLKGDLNVVRDDTYTFISDKQKGLIPAFESVFPGATNRFCVRHLHNNMKTAGFRGLAFKKTLWNVARATTLHEFNLRMEEMGHLDPKAVDWLSDKPPEHWSRSHFNFPLNVICC